MSKKVHADIYDFQSVADGSTACFGRQVYADRIDVIRSRARLLVGRDRAIMIMYLERGNSIAQIARVAGVTEAVISRRVRRLMGRLIDNDFIVCLRHKKLFNRMELNVAKDFYLVGLSQSTIAVERDISVYRVRKVLAKIRAFKKSISKIRRSNV